MEKRKIKKAIQDYGLTVLGTAVYALGVYLFTAPNQIAPGGVSGLATVINYLTGAPIGLITGLVNFPLLVAGWIYLGRGFILRTLVSVVSFSFLYDIAFAPLPFYTGNTLLASVFGGVLIGIGVGLTFASEGSTGGLDIGNMLIKKVCPRFKISQLVFISDVVVIAFATVAYRNIDAALYAIISMFVQTKLIDMVLYGTDMGKMLMVVTSHGDKIVERVLNDLERGVTRIKTTGAYSGKNNETLLCAVSQAEYHKVKRLIYEEDPDAFIMAATAAEVYGYGFRDATDIKH